MDSMDIECIIPITSWQIDGETVETVADSILGGSKITADGDPLPNSLQRSQGLGTCLVCTELDPSPSSGEWQDG